MIAVNKLKTVARLASVLALHKYDDVKDDLIGLFAQTVPPKGRQKIQSIEWWEAFREMQEWIGERKVAGILQSAIDITVKPFEMTFALDRMDLELDGEFAFIQSPEDMAEQFVTGFTTGRLKHAYEPLRANAITTYDGQNIFDTDHVHPDGDTFSNVIDLSAVSASRSASGAPTATEAAAELDLAVDKLMENRLRLQTLVEVTRPTLTVIAKNQGVYSGYRKLLMEDTINNTSNTWKGAFKLLRDYNPESGDEKKVDVIDSTPGGPRPSIFIPVREASGIELDEGRLFAHREISFGADGLFGFGAGMPQPAVRIQE